MKKDSQPKLLSLQYQRNGISGIGFWAADVRNLYGEPGTFLVTFETIGDEDKINVPSCRVVQTDNGKGEYLFYLCWRGDRMGVALEKLLIEERDRLNVESFYDLHSVLENEQTGNKLSVRYKQST